MYITGRIKELLITAGGENVAPVPVEENVKRELPGVSNVMMVGDKKKFITALVTLRTTPDEKTGGFTNQLTGAALEVSSARTVEEAIADPKWRKCVEDGIRRANKLAVSNAQVIQKFEFIAADFSIPGGELTPTLKLKRAFVADKYKQVIEKMYATGD